MKSVFKMVINLSDHLFIIDMLWAVCHKRLYWKPLTRAVCVKWDSGVKAAVILTTIMLDDSKRQCLFSLEYYLLYTYRHFRSRLCVRTFYILKISVQPYRVFFSVNESILFWYCSTVLLFFIYNITHVLQMWHTQHMYYTCDSKKTSVQNFLIAGWDNCWYNFVLNLFCKQDVL